MNTYEEFTPHSLLPAPEPRHDRPAPDYFYENVAKHLIKDVVKLMNNGIHIDMDKVAELESVLEEVLKVVEERLEANPLIREYQKFRHSKIVEEYILDRKEKLRAPEYYHKPFKAKDMVHRSYYMLAFSEKFDDIEPPTELLPTGVPKWSAKQVKVVAIKYKALTRLLEDTIPEDSTFANRAIELMSIDKAAIYNVKFYNDIAHCDELELPKFNPASPDQKHAFFTGMLGLESDKLSDSYKDYEREYRYTRRFKGKIAADSIPRPKNKYSWDRDNVDMVKKASSDEDIIDATEAMIDHSFGAIVKNNFIEAFYNYTIDGRLYGSYKLYGTKTFRLTSNSPNLLNMPSSGSIYAKPIKKCFTAPEGKVILAIDYGALEDRVIASLSRDPNKCDIFNSGLDGHCLNSYYYFKEEIGKHMNITGDTTTDVREYHRLVESGHKELKAIRQRGKAPSFGMQ